MRHIKTFLIAVVVLTFLLSNTYIAMAYITRNARNTVPTYAEPAPALSVPVSEPAPVEPEQPTETEEPELPVDAPEPTGYVYLTIDDGPNPVTTPLILDILDHFGVKATFFVIGTQAKTNPELITEIDRRGHYVGNHTYNHKYREIYATKEAFVHSLNKNDDLIFELIGKRPRYVRAPGGLLTKYSTIKDYTERQGYHVMGWNVDSFDSRNPVPDSKAIAANVHKQSLQEHLWPEMVILVHESSARISTVQALPEIISSLLDRGFVFVIPLEEAEE